MSLFKALKPSQNKQDDQLYSAPSNSSELPFVTNLVDVARLNKKRAILIGNSTFVSMHDVKMHGFVGLQPRKAVSPVKALFVKNPAKVYFSVNEKLVKESPTNLHFAFANDAYLNWGFSTKGNVILLGGNSQENETNLQVFFFEDGMLVDLVERTIHGHASPHYTETASTLIDELLSEAPGSRVVYASPLARFDDSLSGIEYVDDKIFRNIKYAKLSLHEEVKQTGFKLPIAVSIAGVLFFSLAVFQGWTRYQDSIVAFEESINDPVVKQAGGVGSNLIDKMQKQRFFMLETRNQLILAEKTRSLVNGIALIGGVKIVDLSVKVPASPDSPINPELADIRMVLSVPTSSRTVLDQGKEILDTISANTGLNLRMARQGWKEVDKRRTFKLEGNFHG